ncbi:ubiquinone menaquinone biosynthesis C-methyltransferase [Corynascus novoguineensis]|uniref:Ubiquinone menaquinone biosynthesis C-methyltransferase n=1 Tax=Corynascus novoguineensis TaxID=1126955 RepID=A0AAN7CMV3_9PEZI|nr:ubiquinone menaquinone biosynthesis C-methyltransferase [Corynascus novoguineensis]
MSNPEQARQEYDRIAADYNNQYGLTRTGALESELVSIALGGNLAGLSILDLGGGSGIHARGAVERGAAAVDIVDVSPGMMKVAEDIERSLGRNVMRFFEGDAAKPLSHLPLRDAGYDVVMANWVLDFAETRDVLDAMLGNAVRYLKPGGLYGVEYAWYKPIPGGVKYKVVVASDPPIEFEGATLDVLCSGSPEVYEKAGLRNIEQIPPGAARVAQEEPEHWKEFLEDPFFVVVKAIKK